MNTIVWLIQGILALMFGMAGIMKTTQSKDKLVKRLPWVNDYSFKTVRFIGTSELLGGIGLIVPQVTGIMPVLSSVAAVGLAVIMVLAASYHIRKNEYRDVMLNAMLFILLALVAFYRF